MKSVKSILLKKYGFIYFTHKKSHKKVVIIGLK
jgi:hypothetical protein